MRQFLLAIAVVGLVVARTAVADETVTYVDTRGDNLLQADANYLSRVRGAARRTVIYIERRSDGRRVPVSVNVRGPLTSEKLQRLLQPILGTAEGLGSKNHVLTVGVVGDEHRAEVKYGVTCGLLCGGGRSLLYTADDGVWRYLYSYDNWIS